MTRSVSKSIGKAMTCKDLSRRRVDFARPRAGSHRFDGRVVRLQNGRRDPGQFQTARANGIEICY